MKVDIEKIRRAKLNEGKHFENECGVCAKEAFAQAFGMNWLSEENGLHYKTVRSEDKTLLHSLNYIEQFMMMQSSNKKPYKAEVKHRLIELANRVNSGEIKI